MEESKAPSQKRQAWQFYIAYFMGGFLTSVVFEGFLLLSVYFNPDVITVSTIWAVAWVFCLFVYFFVRSCCKWWLGDEDVLDELATQRKNRGESRWEDDNTVGSGANGQRITIKDLFVFEGTEQTVAAVRRANRDRERRIAIVGFLASALGIIGGFAAAYFFQQYWYFSNGPTYTDVSPTADPATISDAHLIYFDSTIAPDQGRGGGLSFSNGKSACSAPIYSAGSAGDAAVGFWAAGDNCCSGRKPTDTWSMSCAFAGNTLGEVLTGDSATNYIAAADQAVAWNSLSRKVGDMYVRILPQSEHDAGQRARLYTAWLCLVAGPLGWPLTIGAMILLEMCLAACNLFDPDPAKRCACCSGHCRQCCRAFGSDSVHRRDDGLQMGSPASADEAVLQATSEAMANSDRPLTGAELRELAAKKRAALAAGEQFGSSSTPRV